MIKKKKISTSIFHIKSIIFFFTIFFLKVHAETKIIAKNGDTLLNLSKEYGVPLKELMYKNNFNDANRIVEGETIIIPLKSIGNDSKFATYKVIEGDTLYKISRDFNVNLKDIISINNLDNVSFLIPGQLILLPKGSTAKNIIGQKNIKLASKKVFYHQTSRSEKLSDIAKIHGINKQDIVNLNKLKDPINIAPNSKLKIRKDKDLKWLKYGPIIINWSDWRYFGGYYITQAKNKRNSSFYLAISCKERVLTHALKNYQWTSWYFPKSDFEFKLINDFCDHNFKI